MSPYREQASPSGGVGVLQKRIAALEAQVTPHFWRALGDEENVGLDELRRACRELAGEEAVEAHVRLVASLEALLERLPGIEEGWGTAPSEAPRELPFPSGRWTREPKRTLALARQLDKRAAIAGGTDDDAIVRLTVYDCPISLRLLQIDAATDFLAVATSVPRSMAAVRAVLATPFDEIKGALGLLDDVEIGEDEIDALFKIAGEPGHARVLIGPPVRSALRMLAGIGEPALVTGDQCASLSWRGTAPTVRQLDRIAHALAWLRAAPPTLALRAPAAGR